jgi:hypothetical protein
MKWSRVLITQSEDSSHHIISSHLQIADHSFRDLDLSRLARRAAISPAERRPIVFLFPEEALAPVRPASRPIRLYGEGMGPLACSRFMLVRAIAERGIACSRRGSPAPAFTSSWPPSTIKHPKGRKKDAAYATTVTSSLASLCLSSRRCDQADLLLTSPPRSPETAEAQPSPAQCNPRFQPLLPCAATAGTPFSHNLHRRRPSSSSSPSSPHASRLTLGKTG